MLQEVLQKLLKDPDIQESRKREEGEEEKSEGFIAGELSGKSALQVSERSSGHVYLFTFSVAIVILHCCWYDSWL